jgi:hypothetical protein
MNYFKYMFTLMLASSVLFLYSCEAEDIEDAPTAVPVWSVTWVRDFVFQPPKPLELKNLCVPGKMVAINFAGIAETAQQNGPGKGLNAKIYITPGAASAPSASSVYYSFAEIEYAATSHTEVGNYMNGQPANVRKSSYGLNLESYNAPTSNFLTVFMNIPGEMSVTKTRSDGTTYIESDKENRISGFTVDCNSGTVSQSFKGAGIKGNGVKSPSVDLIKKSRAFIFKK